MGARPLRRAIQRYIEDPLADEVLKAGPDSIEPGTTVMVSRDEAGDENDQPLSLELIPPSEAERMRRAEEKEKRENEKHPVGVGAAESAGDDVPGDDLDSGDGVETAHDAE